MEVLANAVRNEKVIRIIKMKKEIKLLCTDDKITNLETIVCFSHPLFPGILTSLLFPKHSKCM